MASSLTVLQERVFRFICDFADENGFPPSYSDIAGKFQFSSDGTVRTYLEHLEKKGFIQRLGKARGLKILKPLASKSIPILGKIPAGHFKQALEDPLGTVDELPELQGSDGRFALKVSGDSMKDAGILDGDLAIVQTNVPVHNGQIAAVAVQGGEVTLKRVYFEKDRVRLQPENEFYEPLYIQRTDFEAKVIGRYIALVRKV
jgi:repressor LexA